LTIPRYTLNIIHITKCSSQKITTPEQHQRCKEEQEIQAEVEH